MKVLIHLKYHEKFMAVSLNQIHSKVDENHSFKGLFFVKSHFQWIKWLEGTYDVVFDGENLTADLKIKKDYAELKLNLKGKISHSNISLDYRIDHNVGSREAVFGKIEHKRRNSVITFRSSIKHGSKDIVIRMKYENEIDPKFDLDIESKGLYPARLRIRYNGKLNKKVFKSELKYQNNQLAGCNFQYSYESSDNILFIAKTKFQQNAIELDINVKNSSSLLYMNLFLENRSILLMKYENKNEHNKNSLYAKLFSIFNFLHDFELDCNSYHLKDENKTAVSLKLNDFVGTLDLIDKSRDQDSRIILVSTNLDVIKNGKLEMRSSQEFNESIKSINCQLNEISFKIILKSEKIKELHKYQIQVEGEWGEILIITEVLLGNKKFEAKIELIDSVKRSTVIQTKYHESENKRKLLIIINTPFTDAMEVVGEQEGYSIFLQIKESKSSTIYGRAKMNIETSDDNILITSSFASYWTQDYKINIQIIGRINEMLEFRYVPSISLMMEIKRKNLNIFSTAFMIQSIQLVHSINIRVKTLYPEYEDIEITARADMNNKAISLKMMISESLYFALISSYSKQNGHSVFLNVELPIFGWNSIGCNITLDRNWNKLLLSVNDLQKFFILNTSYGYNSGNLMMNMHLNSTFTTFKTMDITADMNLESRIVVVTLKTDDNSHDFYLDGKMKKEYGELRINALLPQLFQGRKEISIRFEFEDSRYKINASFDGEEIEGIFILTNTDDASLSLRTPFDGFENINATIKFEEENLTAFNLKVNDIYFNGSFLYNSKIFTFKLQSSLETIKQLKIELQYKNIFDVTKSGINLILDVDSNGSQFLLKLESKQEKSLEVSIRKDAYKIGFKHQHNIYEHNTFKTSIIYENDMEVYFILLYSEQSRILMETRAPFFNHVKIEIQYVLLDLKLNVEYANKDILTAECNYNFIREWIGDFELSFFMDVMNMKKIRLKSNYTLDNQQKKIDFKVSYGGKVK